ncbi:MAG: D-glycero-beta-D-manno-heptose 1-phosphate adenylyltransferase [Thermodesulfobacterium sp.]|nr:D-glycero-beta-D-manno-heptose 1-phosphate adenylyltransferase [Thermodesulfobacterium sp.]
MLKISIVQMEVKHSLEENLQKIKNFIELAKGNLIFFPELALTGYKFPFDSSSQKNINEALLEVQNLTKSCGKSVLLGAPHYEENKIYNAVYLISPKTIKVLAEKNLLFPELDKNFFPGKKRELLEIDGFKIGIIICFELRSPEIARTLTKEGINLLAVFAQWPKARIKHWKALLRARAIENQIFVAGVNALSQIENLVIAGHSLSFSPSGEALNKKSEKEEIIEVSIPLKLEKLPYPMKIPCSKISHKIKNLDELKSIVQKRKEKGQVMVFTNGCFDILHAGHVHYLNSARALGDFLVVGLNSDKSVKKIKGVLRPVNFEKERAYVLAGLECVDYVVFFDEETPEKLIKSLKPDILVKGADWEEDKIVGASYIKSYGGKVKRISFEFDTSTTKIIEKILKIYKD